MRVAPERSPRTWKPYLAGWYVGLALIAPLVLRWQPAMAATFTVTHTADAGPGSLRAAIEAANAAPGADTILFRIPTSDPGFSGGVFTLRPASQLPAVQGPTFLDGLSQTGFTGNTNPNGPEIVLNGSQAGSANGLFVTGPDSVIRSLVINGFSRDGILIDGANAVRNRVEGCYVGTNSDGTAAVPNGWNGIEVFDLPRNNRIGGTDARTRNLVSGNAMAGILLFEADANVVLGNYIGTNAAGSAAVPNQSAGISLRGTREDRIGGTEPGSRNLISGNQRAGIGMDDAHRCQVQGNYIGTDVRGETAIPNGTSGVETTQVSQILLGGTSSSARNVISGNQIDGVTLAHVASDCLVQGNYIGLNAGGTAALPNRLSGVVLYEGIDNLIGGSTASARNVISGNGLYGIALFAASQGNRIQGNYIGTNPVGRVSLPNGANGVQIGDSSMGNLVGGPSAGARNLISGNTLDGVQISGASVVGPTEPNSANNEVQGNFIGTDVSGDRALPNGAHGIELIEGARNNTIGGTTAGARNVVSGNTQHGVSLDGAGTQENVIAGNHIGTNFAGTVALPNGIDGVRVMNGAQNNRIGGTTPEARNLISGNRASGIGMTSSGLLNRVEGNFIGTNLSGSGPLPNRIGVLLTFVSGVSIGANLSGARNVISGNLDGGVVVGPSFDLRILGNYIGTNALGTTAVPNGGAGISINSAFGARSQIGGTTPLERNVISGNTGTGISLGFTSDNQIQGNYIGVNAAGTTAVPNGGDGVSLTRANNILVGGTTVGSRNVISGNLGHGVSVGSSSAINQLFGNFIGTNAGGSLAVPNGGHGVAVSSANGTTIGGPAAGAGNLISGNTLNGILISNSQPFPTFGNSVRGNLIGTNALGTGALPNRGHGVELSPANVQGSIVGSPEPGAGNRIAFNLGDGVLVRTIEAGATTLVGNSIRANAIHSNRGLGINLQPAGEPSSTVTPNDFQDPDVGPNRLQNFPVLTSAVAQTGVQTTITGTLNSTPNSPFALDFFRSAAPDPSGFGEGQQYLGSLNVTTDGSGNASFVFVATGAGAGEAGFFTATATVAGMSPDSNDTSEFSVALRGTTTPAGDSVPPGAQLAGRVADAAGTGVLGVRLSLHSISPGETYSPDWDPSRLQVTQTDASGAFHFAALPRGRYLVLAWAPGMYFTPRARLVNVGTERTMETAFTVAGGDEQRPTATITTPASDSQGSGPTLAQGTVADVGGSGVRAVLVRLHALDPEPEQPTRRLDWQTGTWDTQPADGQTRWALLDAAGTGWQVDLPHLTPGSYRLEVQAYDWAGHGSEPVTAAFRVR